MAIVLDSLSRERDISSYLFTNTVRERVCGFSRAGFTRVPGEIEEFVGGGAATSWTTTKNESPFASEEAMRKVRDIPISGVVSARTRSIRSTWYYVKRQRTNVHMFDERSKSSVRNSSVESVGRQR